MYSIFFSITLNFALITEIIVSVSNFTVDFGQSIQNPLTISSMDPTPSPIPNPRRVGMGAALKAKNPSNLGCVCQCVTTNAFLLRTHVSSIYLTNQKEEI